MTGLVHYSDAGCYGGKLVACGQAWVGEHGPDGTISATARVSGGPPTLATSDHCLVTCPDCLARLSAWTARILRMEVRDP